MLSWNLLFCLLRIGKAVALDQPEEILLLQPESDPLALLTGLTGPTANLSLFFLRDLFVSALLVWLLRPLLAARPLPVLGALAVVTVFDLTQPLVFRPSILFFVAAGAAYATRSETLTAGLTRTRATTATLGLAAGLVILARCPPGRADAGTRGSAAPEPPGRADARDQRGARRYPGGPAHPAARAADLRDLPAPRAADRHAVAALDRGWSAARKPAATSCSSCWRRSPRSLPASGSAISATAPRRRCRRCCAARSAAAPPSRRQSGRAPIRPRRDAGRIHREFAVGRVAPRSGIPRLACTRHRAHLDRVRLPVRSFVVRASRGGTAMMRSMLNNHPAIHIAGETHYFDDLRVRLAAKARGAARPGRGAASARTYFRALSHRPYGHAGDPEQGWPGRRGRSEPKRPASATAPTPGSRPSAG